MMRRKNDNYRVMKEATDMNTIGNVLVSKCINNKVAEMTLTLVERVTTKRFVLEVEGIVVNGRKISYCKRFMVSTHKVFLEDS